MADKLNIATGVDWFYPGFGRYGVDMARKMTEFLYSDPGNPFAHDHDAWKRAGVVRVGTKPVTWSALTNTTTTRNDARLLSGRNFLILGRMANGITAAGGSSVNMDMFTAQQDQADGTIIDDTTSMALLFGTGENPFILPVPDLVLGTATRRWSVTNNSGATATIYATFMCAWLDVIGR